MENNYDDFGGGSSWLMLLLFAVIFGWGGGGFGGNNATNQEILFGQQFQNLNSAINKIGDGLSSLGYAQLQQMDGNTASINGNVVSEGRNLQSQLANCCCENQKNVDSVRFDMANYSANIQSAIHSEGEATRNLIQQNKMEALQQRVNILETQNIVNSATAGVVKYPMSTTYTSGSNPFCGCTQMCNVI